MLPGPKRTSRKALDGRGSWRAAGRQDTPEATRGRPAQPKTLSDREKRIWNRVCDELDSMDTLYTCDVAILHAYVVWYAQFCEQTTLLRKHVAGTMSHRRVAASLNEANKNMIQASGELGLTPASRSRIHVVPGGKANDDKAKFFRDNAPNARAG